MYNSSGKKPVKPKKFLGQHFLKDKLIAHQIVASLTLHQGYETVLEIGAGTGVLSGFLLDNPSFTTWLLDVDTDSIRYLKENYPTQQERILYADFLKMDLTPWFNARGFAIIGNFPYNISSQIFFKILDVKDQVKEIVCMLQKEVAQRIASPPGNKNYGILSVFLQAYYDIEFLFTVPPEVFNPPPKVHSAVIRLKRNAVDRLPCNETLFRKVVKQGFQNRRKTLRNALNPLNLPLVIRQQELLDRRAEQLTVADFVALTNQIDYHGGTER